MMAHILPTFLKVKDTKVVRDFLCLRLMLLLCKVFILTDKVSTLNSSIYPKQ